MLLCCYDILIVWKSMNHPVELPTIRFSKEEKLFFNFNPSRCSIFIEQKYWNFSCAHDVCLYLYGSTIISFIFQPLNKFRCTQRGFFLLFCELRQIIEEMLWGWERENIKSEREKKISERISRECSKIMKICENKFKFSPFIALNEWISNFSSFKSLFKIIFFVQKPLRGNAEIFVFHRHLPLQFALVIARVRWKIVCFLKFYQSRRVFPQKSHHT